MPVLVYVSSLWQASRARFWFINLVTPLFFFLLLLLAFQHVPTKNETATKLVTNFFRIPLSYLSQIGRSKRQVTQQDIVVILDRSGSIGDCNYKKAKQALKNMLDIASKVGYDNRYAAVTFASHATTDFKFVANPDAGIKIKNLPYIPGSTNTQAALQDWRSQFRYVQIHLDRKPLF